MILTYQECYLRTLLYVFVIRYEGESKLKSIHKVSSPLSLCSYKHSRLDELVGNKYQLYFPLKTPVVSEDNTNRH